MKLSEIGEYKLLQEYVMPLLKIPKDNIYDDCVYIKDKNLIWTTDPTPTPIAWLLGIKKPEIFGWYTGLINLSDIAADGGKPIGLLVSVEIPEDYEVDYYMKFNQGLEDICSKYNTNILGGNLKSSNTLRATGTALGIIENNILNRKGIESDDSIYIIGETGYFWAAVLDKLYNHNSHIDKTLEEKLLKSICYPEPKLNEASILSSLDFRVNCMDSSDGILSCVQQYATINNKDIYIYEDKVEWNLPDIVKDIYMKHNINLDTACYSWGEWQLVCSIPKDKVKEFELILLENNILFYDIGYVKEGDGKVFSDVSKKELNKIIMSERFQNDTNKFLNVENMIESFLKKEIFI